MDFYIITILPCRKPGFKLLAHPVICRERIAVFARAFTFPVPRLSSLAADSVLDYRKR
jgi:hypothetical protein